MVRQGRVLIIDNLEQWCNALVEILRSGGYHADSASTVSEALKMLHENFYHLLVADIRMEETVGSNIDGMVLLHELKNLGLDEATKVIMLSAYGTEDQMRTAFRDFKVVDFISKDEFSEQSFLKSIKQAFLGNVKINLNLEILFQTGTSSEQAVLNLKVDGTRVEHGTPLQNQLAIELEDLLCRLFYNTDGILVRPLTTGRSGARVLRIQPFYSNNGIAREVVVKFGDVRKIQQEYDNFKEYVEPFVGDGRSTAVLDVRRATHLGGIIYTFLGTSSDQLVDFAEFYLRASVLEITDVLDRLFMETCGTWYANHKRQLLDLTADYRRLFGSTPIQLEQIVSRQLKSVRVRQRLRFSTLKIERTFTNPLPVMARSPLAFTTFTCSTHGDFNQHNLLVDKTGHVWLIDFQDTGKSHILRDVAMLDSVVRFQLLTAQDAPLEDRLLMEESLCSIENFSQVGDLVNRFSPSNPELAKAYSVVIHLRRLASKLVERNPNDDMSEYYTALLYSALNTLRFSSLQQVQLEHALLSASLLVDKLGLDK